MPDNYQFLDAYSSTQTVASSLIGSVHHPVVKITSVISVNISGNPSVSVGNVTVGVASVISYNAPVASFVSGTADLRGNAGASVAIIAGQGGAIKTYITGLQVANLGSASVLVTLAGNSQGGSTLGYTIAPAGGGSNVVYTVPLVTGGNQPFTASISGIASVLLSAQGFTI